MKLSEKIFYFLKDSKSSGERPKEEEREERK